MQSKNFPEQSGSSFEHQLLKAVFDLTCHKDYVDLTKKLLSDIRKIPSVKSAHIYEIYGRKNGSLKDDSDQMVLRDVVNIMETPQPIREAIKRYPKDRKLTKPHTTKFNDELLQSTFPISNESALERVLVIESGFLSKEQYESIIFSARVYGNILTIIDDKDRDRLTGLLNRHTFNNQVSNIIEYSRLQAMKDRGECPETSWLAILDIDFFKQVNDVHGHLIGDDVLLMFARLMERSFRYTDILFRYGGEEFVVILNGCDSAGALKSLERFRKMVESYQFPIVEKVTVSIGFIQLFSEEVPATLIDEADKALYFAKESGRNQTVSYSEMPEQLLTELELD